MNEDSNLNSTEYREVDLSVPLNRLPWWLTPLSILLFVIPFGLFMWLLPPRVDFNELIQWQNLLWVVILVIVHELIHALGWTLTGGAKWSQIAFGFSWKGLAPYAHAKAPMPLRPYRIGGVAPGVLLGLLPAILAFVMGSFTLVALAGLMLSAAIGDFYILWTLRKVPGEAKVLDHPSNAGCIVLLPLESSSPN